MAVPPSSSVSSRVLYFLLLFRAARRTISAQSDTCDVLLQEQCRTCAFDTSDDEAGSRVYNCSLPGLEFFSPGQYEGVSANYLSFVTETSSPNMPIRAKEFEACTGGQVIFSEASNVWEDPVKDIGTKSSRGAELYDGYFMSYSHFPEVSALGLAEPLNDRIRKDNARLKWEDVLPKVRTMAEYRRGGETSVDFLMMDGDFFVPIIRLDLLEKNNIALPNTWNELVDIANFFHGQDLNGDGEPDFGLCHFPRLGAGDWDQWFSEVIYSTWATYSQTQGIEQGFLFDSDTFEPNINEGFEASANIWKELWNHGSNACDGGNFETGRCAVGYGPPGCWKSVFLNGVARKDQNGTAVWRPTHLSGKYAEPYRFKPPGSTEVVHPITGELVPCTPGLCPRAEIIPAGGHHGGADRVNQVLPKSPLEGQLVNRAPFYWSGGLGGLIRKSAKPIKKDLMWDFFVYTNSPETSVEDVASYASWLDSWRHSQLVPGNNFIEAGWSQQAYEEHAAMQQWGLSSDVNGALNMRLPGVARYTDEVMGEQMKKFINGTIPLDTLQLAVSTGWELINQQEGKLDQLATYRASQGLEAHSEFELCQLHRVLVDEKDPSICRKFEDSGSKNNFVLRAVLISLAVVVAAVVIGGVIEHRRRAMAKLDLLRIKEEDDDSRDEIHEIEKLTEADNRRVIVCRTVIFIVMIAATVTLPYFARNLLLEQDEDDFNENYFRVAGEIRRSVEEYNNGIHVAVDALSKLVTLDAQASSSKWPSAHLSSLDPFFSSVIEDRRLDGIAVLPLVAAADRASFVSFESVECPSRLRDSHFSFYGSAANFAPGVAGNQTGNLVFTADGLSPQESAQDAAVVSYRYPPPSSCQVQTINFRSGPDLQPLLESAIALDKTLSSAIQSSNAVVSGYFPQAQHEKTQYWSQDSSAAYPSSFVVTPVHNSLDASDDEIVALLLVSVAHDVPLRDMVPDDVKSGFDVVVRNNVGQSLTFRLNGRVPVFVGYGDYHNKDYNHLEVQFHLGGVESLDLLAESSLCQYSVSIYPAGVTKASLSSSSKAFVYSLAVVFVLLLFANLMYDWLVRQRTRKLVINAAKSSEIVTSLFPEQIRDRLLNETKVNKQANRDKNQADHGAFVDLYPSTTVLFADVEGFTSWASSRQPQTVFALLEAVFGTFDRLAKRRGVYKVETIGDCYVAVCGAPEERVDHAIRMCRFARDCVIQFRRLSRNLVKTLGPDTQELSLRVGMHSGQVTAGVLRGERSRFQLFGDTVNTTARMESTSRGGLVQLSRETADLVSGAGLQRWLTPRKDVVEAKGKGSLQTYWLDLKAEGYDAESYETSSNISMASSFDDDLDIMKPAAAELKQRQLVEWNVETLLGLLKKIVAYRKDSDGTCKMSIAETPSDATDFGPRGGATAYLNEVSEIISLPRRIVDFDDQDISNVILPASAVHQLRMLVTAVASMYNLNSFHNFEHASHVTLSVTKLLSRIVMPSLRQKSESNASVTDHDRSYGITSDPLTQFACVFAALIHDADHPGIPNKQLIEENPELGFRYDERSVAEQNSLTKCFSLLSESRFSQLRGIIFEQPEDQERFRSLVINMVLATDIVDKDLKDLRNARWKTAFDGAPARQNGSSARFAADRKATIVIEHLIQASDVAHTMQHWHVYRKWNERLFTEMYAAYKTGRAKQDPSETWAKGEIVFFDFYIIPLAKKLKECGVFGVSSDEYLNYALANRREWGSRGHEIVSEMTERLKSSSTMTKKMDDLSLDDLSLDDNPVSDGGVDLSTLNRRLTGSSDEPKRFL